jgi:hypothetical protein
VIDAISSVGVIQIAAPFVSEPLPITVLVVGSQVGMSVPDAE